MNKIRALLGSLLIICSCIFAILLSVSNILVLALNSQFVYLLASILIALLLPTGSALAFLGFYPRRRFSFHGTILASGAGSVSSKASGGRTLGIIALIIAIVLGGAALGISLSNYNAINSNSSSYNQLGNTVSSNYSQLKGGLSSLNGSVTSLNGSLASISSLNEAPAVVGIKLQWCTQNVLQDRFCPNNIVVVQGDIVQLFFLQNDTAAHTFSMLSPYNFQINDSGAGELNFLTNYSPIPGNCSNSGTFAQMSAGISGVYCVSGTSLLPNSTLASHGANIFAVAQNPNPGLPFTSGSQCVSGEPMGTCLMNPGPILVPVDDSAHVISLSVTGVGVNATGGSETQGIGAFQATVPGVFEFFCHYHVANGMFGYLIVLPNAYCTTHASACKLVGG